MFAESQDQHVRVARGTGEATDPRELAREVFDDVCRKYVTDLSEQRAGASDRHAEVVQKFTVDVSPDAGFVRREDLEHGPVDLPRPDVGAHLRIQRKPGR